MRWLLTISELGGSWAGRPPVVTSHDSHYEAETELEEYVRRRWAAEMDDPMPEDESDLVEQYFDGVSEDYEITQDWSR